ncbi:unnamed protein product [Brassica rapa subsp. trilocularis]
MVNFCKFKKSRGNTIHAEYVRNHWDISSGSIEEGHTVISQLYYLGGKHKGDLCCHSDVSPRRKRSKFSN